MLLNAAFSQQKDVLFNRQIYIDLEHDNNRSDRPVHTGLKPVLESRVDLTNTMGYVEDSAKYYYEITEALFGRHLVDIKGPDYRLTVDPQFNFEAGNDLKNSSYADTVTFFTNTRGFSITGDLGERFSFQTRFYENQATVPLYMFNRIQRRKAFPGQGRPKQFGKKALDYGWAVGKVSWSPMDELNIQFGSDRHFVGSGYRSVLLSDNAFNYPFLKASALLLNGKVQYSAIFARLQTFNRLETGESSESLFYWKKASFHHLSVALGPVQLGLFEASQFQTLSDSGLLATDPLEFNPLIGVNTAANGFGDANHQMVGVDLKASVTEDIIAYAQYATDGPSDGRMATQVGVRFFDVLGTGLHVQMERNAAESFMYTNNPSVMAYTHFGQALAHPYGADFEEFVLIMDKRFKRISTMLKVNYATIHTDTAAMVNSGNDLFLPLSDDTMEGEPIEQELLFVETQVSYILNPYYNMRFSVGFRWRQLSPADHAQGSSYLYIGWHTDLFNKYYDF